MSDEPAKPDPDTEKRQRAAVEALLQEAPVHHASSVQLADGRRLAYEMTAGFIPVVDTGIERARGEPQAAVFTVAYRVDAEAGAPPRPLCFAFNGGPGSASIWLHLGALGPKRVPTNDDGTMPPAPYRVVDNPLTWLEHFDLVFVDPPHTGYSIAASDDARKRALLGTPYSASDWSLAQLDVPDDVMARVTHRYYDAGHMMYTRGADLARLAADLATWLGQAGDPPALGRSPS